MSVQTVDGFSDLKKGIVACFAHTEVLNVHLFRKQGNVTVVANLKAIFLIQLIHNDKVL